MAYLKTLKNSNPAKGTGKAMQPASYGSLSPDEMKTYADLRVNQIGLNAMTKARTGTGQRAPMPKPRRDLFRQGYWKAARPHPDYTLGDLFGTVTRKEETSGGKGGPF